MSALDQQDLPAALTRYLDHRREAGYDAGADFARDAVVVDDGATYAGIDAIVDWIATAETEFTYTTTVLGTEGDRGAVTVTNRLEGDFPGGVVDLRYRFQFTDSGLIHRLVIEA